MNTETINKAELPNFVKEQCKVIDSLQQRVNQLNKAFEIEKNCKNQVYSFILKEGYFDEYVAFNAKNPI